jgi:chemotaxis protein MotA
MFVIVGWLVVMGCVFGVFIVHGGNIMVVLKALPFELITIGGATLGAFLANNQMKVVKATIAGLGRCFKGSKYTKARYMDLLALLYDILQKARKEGLMAIEKDVEEPHSSEIFKKHGDVGHDHHVVEFITDYLRMMVSGNLNAHEIESLMDSEIDTHHAEEHAAVAALQRVAGGLPAFGIVAAVLGVVNTMGSVGQPPCRFGWHDRLGAGRYLFGYFAGLCLCRAVGGPAGAKGGRSRQRAAMHQNHLAGQYAGLQPGHCH